MFSSLSLQTTMQTLVKWRNHMMHSKRRAYSCTMKRCIEHFQPRTLKMNLQPNTYSTFLIIARLHPISIRGIKSRKNHHKNRKISCKRFNKLRETSRWFQSKFRLYKHYRNKDLTKFKLHKDYRNKDLTN